MPRIQMRVDLRGGFLPRDQAADVILLHLLGALQDIFDLDFVRRQRAALSPVPRRPVDDEVVRVVGCGDAAVDVWLVGPFFLHDGASRAGDAEVRDVGDFEARGAGDEVEVVGFTGIGFQT